MDILLYLISIALTLGFLGLGTFMWTLKSNQYEDLEGAVHRILIGDEDKSEDIWPKSNLFASKSPIYQA
jgi:cbb3-type cytochrome oxidase maturation protein